MATTVTAEEVLIDYARVTRNGAEDSKADIQYTVTRTLTGGSSGTRTERETIYLQNVNLTANMISQLNAMMAAALTLAKNREGIP